METVKIIVKLTFGAIVTVMIAVALSTARNGHVPENVGIAFVIVLIGSVIQWYFEDK